MRKSRALPQAVVLMAAALFAAAVVAADAPRMELITLGTGGGPTIRVERAQSANAIVIGDDIYLVDVGDAVLRQLAAADLHVEKVRAIFITHHHFDHNAGLGPLLTRRWLGNTYSPVPVHGPPLTQDMVLNLGKAYRAVEVAPITIGGPPKPPIASTASPHDLPPELMEPKVIYEDENLKVSAVLNDHYHLEPGSIEAKLARSYAYRFDSPARSIVFTGDTGPSTRVETLARGADLLVSEVIDLARIEKSLRENAAPDFPIDELIAHLRKDHLTPSQVGELAARAKVKEVVLSHIVPGWDGETDLSVYTRGIDAHFKGPVRVARDLDRF